MENETKKTLARQMAEIANKTKETKRIDDEYSRIIANIRIAAENKRFSLELHTQLGLSDNDREKVFDRLRVDGFEVTPFNVSADFEEGASTSRWYDSTAYMCSWYACG